MLILGHAGITLGAGALLAGAVRSRRSKPTWNLSWFTALSSYLDIRLLLIGSLLPDIIDKPVGQYFFRETFSNGRIFSHTLLFLILMTAVGFYLYKRRHQVWLLTLAAGTFVHLILDKMWLAPRTLFWPLLGTAFDRIYLADWVSNILRALMTNPEVFVPEAVGLVILLWFGLSLVFRKKVGAFIKCGEIK
jgi:inner membrane protein